MKIWNRIAISVLLTWAAVASAQTHQPPSHRASSRVVDDWVNRLETMVVGAADAMPADKYPFAPTDGEFKGVRTFAQQVKHAAATNYILGAAILGMAPPPDAGDETGPDTVRTKAEIQEYLKGSFAFLHKAVATIDDQNAAYQVLLSRPSEVARLVWGWPSRRLRISLITTARWWSIYAWNGVVPPASR